jgi:hypothetical protein
MKYRRDQNQDKKYQNCFVRLELKIFKFKKIGYEKIGEEKGENK